MGWLRRQLFLTYRVGGNTHRLRSEKMGTGAVALQVTRGPATDPLERLLDVFDRVRDAKAHIAFAEIAEGGAG